MFAIEIVGLYAGKTKLDIILVPLGVMLVSFGGIFLACPFIWLVDKLGVLIAKATGIPKEELPIIESNANVDHAECEALELLREKICIRLLGS